MSTRDPSVHSLSPQFVPTRETFSRVPHHRSRPRVSPEPTVKWGLNRCETSLSLSRCFDYLSSESPRLVLDWRFTTFSLRTFDLSPYFAPLDLSVAPTSSTPGPSTGSRSDPDSVGTWRVGLYHFGETFGDDWSSYRMDSS